MRPRTTAAALLLLLAGCPKAVPLAPPPPPASTKPSPQALLATEVEAIAKEAVTFKREQDEALWAHWTAGAPLELEQLAAKHAALLEGPALMKVRLRLDQQPPNAVGLKRLEQWLAAQKLTRESAPANDTLTQLEAGATFRFNGKDVHWRELGRLLSNEKSAVKRKALWEASREALPAVAEGHRVRDAALPARVPSEDDVALARRVLEETAAEWQHALEQLARSELGLPVEKLTRADLPRLLKPSPLADVTFPRKDEAARAAAVLGVLGLYGLPGVTLDLGESAKKNPLPLTLAPGGASDVRVSFRPGGGVRDLANLFAELGTAVALHQAAEGEETLPTLAEQPLAEAAAALFAEIAGSAQWLKEAGAAEDAANAAALSLRAVRLFNVRRAAANVIAAHAAGQSDEVSAEVWRAASAQAVGIALATEDLARWRLESDPLGLNVALLHGWARVGEWKKSLGDAWWKEPASAQTLKALLGSKPVVAAPSRPDAGVPPGDAGAPG